MRTPSGIAILAALIVLAPGPALAGTLTGGATMPEQVVQEVTALTQYVAEAQQLHMQIQMVYNEALNLENLPQNFASQMNGELSQLTSLVGQGNSLSYAGQNITAQFQQEYPSWSPSQNFGQDYQNWYGTTNQDISNALQAQHLNAQNFATQDQALQSIESASQSAPGRMKVLQAGNQISAMEVKSLQHLQQITMAESDAQLAYEKQKISEENATKQATTQWLLGTSIPAVSGPGIIPGNLPKLSGN
jgi:P-type conjugative transfer protein TrbJ